MRNTPDSRSSALLVRVTRCDQRRRDCLRAMTQTWGRGDWRRDPLIFGASRYFNRFRPLGYHNGMRVGPPGATMPHDDRSANPAALVGHSIAGKFVIDALV